MLLPSALSCESRQPSGRSRFPTSRLFPATPEPSDDGFIAGNGLLGTCRALQSLLNASPASSPRRVKPDRLESPLQIRAGTLTRVAKPVAKPPRGIHKRRRDAYEDESGDEIVGDSTPIDRFSTPKRQRRAPPEIPLGLDLQDFKSLDSPKPSQFGAPLPLHQVESQPLNDPTPSNIPPQADAPPSPETSSDWTSEDDGRLVELVLEKLKLSKRDWNECARKMGKDNDSVGKRWKALVVEGNVGLRRGRCMVRPAIHESWR